ncbi:MAG: CBS domain-containing protein [Armatimonadota bacterium]|nr:CBS domain-containing protein [Armatimonadota bacterium]MDR7452985.1 CBS domain-containing protein [Armatimonadota bacterium]MDR7496186.1 CBS domain-containing protein [Armatimonadota bacterium]
MLTVADVMSRQPVAVHAAATVADALRVMRAHGISSVLVPPLAGSPEYGIVTMQDVLAKVVRAGADARTVRLGDVMTWRLVTAEPGWTVRRAAEAMADARVRRLPVTDGRGIVGLVSDTDIFTSLVPREEWGHVRRVRKERALRRAAAAGPAAAVADLMSSPVLTIAGDAPVRDAVAKMVAAGISSLLVTAPGGPPAAIVTKRDVVTKAVAHGRPIEATRVEALASGPLRTVAAEATVEACSAEMAAARVRRLPVTREGQIVGIVSDSDILAAVAGGRWVGKGTGPTAAIAADVLRAPPVAMQASTAGALAPETSLWECAARLADAGTRELPVVQDGQVIGVVGEEDIVRALAERGGHD